MKEGMEYGEERYKKIQSLMGHAMMTGMICADDAIRDRTLSLMQTIEKQYGVKGLKGEDLTDFLYTPDRKGEEYLNEIIKVRQVGEDYQGLYEKYIKEDEL